MIRKLFLTTAVALFLLAGCGDTGSLPTPADGQAGAFWVPPNPRLLDAALRETVERHLTANNVPGALVMVSTPQGKWLNAYGYADLAASRPIDFRDHLAWRSITKTFTVTLMLQLVAEGVLELDAPVGDYLDGVPNGETITLRHLAAMRSGLPEYSVDEQFQQALVEDLGRAWTDAELLEAAFRHPVNFAAGSRYEYSNTNTVLLGVVAATVTGKSVEELFKERFLQPLALTQSKFALGVELPAPVALGYTYDADEQRFIELLLNGSALSSAGAMAGTIIDLATWGQALVDGSLLPAELQRLRFVSGAATSGPIYDSYGLGIGELAGWWGHTGNGLGYQAAVMTEPRTASQIVILLNAANGNNDVPADIVKDVQKVLGWTTAGLP